MPSKLIVSHHEAFAQYLIEHDLANEKTPMTARPTAETIRNKVVFSDGSVSVPLQVWAAAHEVWEMPLTVPGERHPHPPLTLAEIKPMLGEMQGFMVAWI